MNESKRSLILETLKNCPLVSTDHIARYFTNNSPGKRASEALCFLEGEKLIEGRRREPGKPKVWRLTKRGREAVGIDVRPVSFTTAKIEHYLGLCTVWQDLQRIGILGHWRIELRENFVHGGKKYVYAPDALFSIRTKDWQRLFLLEYQHTPITSNRWAEKWAIASMFFDGHDKAASWQKFSKPVKPYILVLSQQQKETVTAGTRLPVTVGRTVYELFSSSSMGAVSVK